MKKVVVSLLAVVFAAGTALAATPPETVVIKNSVKGDVTFPHKKHEAAGLLKDCKVCHEEATGGKIAKLGKDKGHANCLTCHREKGNGKAPTSCPQCHKK